MRRLTKGGWGIALAVGLSLAPQLRAGDMPVDPGAKKADSGSWFGSWFGTKEKPGTSKTPASSKTKNDDNTTAGKNAPGEDGTAERAREMATLLRRLTVCDQLRMIAARKNDDVLMRRANTLDEQAWQIYTQRIAHLPAGQAVIEPGAKLGEPTREVSAKAKGK